MTDAFPSILSEARKYRLNLTLINQYLDQVPRNIKKEVRPDASGRTSFVSRSGAGDGNRTHMTSLEGWSSTTELHPPEGTIEL